MNKVLEKFVCHGGYTWSNSCGFWVEIDESGDSARLASSGLLETDPYEITPWLEIESRMKEDWYPKCDQCNAEMIQGIYCHETGCPNTDKTKYDGSWLTDEELQNEDEVDEDDKWEMVIDPDGYSVPLDLVMRCDRRVIYGVLKEERE